MSNTYIYVWIDGEAVGYTDAYMGAAEDRDIFAPFGSLYLREEQPDGEITYSRCKTFDESGASTAEKATALLKEYLAAVVGMYEVNPIVSSEEPKKPDSVMGNWKRLKVRDIALDEMLQLGFVEDDLRDIRRCAIGTELGSLKLKMGRHWMLILPSTTEEEIRSIARLYASDVIQGWRKGDTETLPKSRELRDSLKGYVSTADAARMMGCTQNHVNLLCRDGAFPGARKIGRIWAIPREEIETYEPGLQGFAAHPENIPNKKQN